MQKYYVEKVRNYIGGEWSLSSSKEWVKITNPATGDEIGSVPQGSASDVDAAVAAAKRAFPAWRDTPAPVRARYMFDLRNLMEKHYDELLSICTQEHGKTYEESKGDVRRGIDNVETAAGIPMMMLGDALEQVSTGIDCVSFRQPMGVFGIIAPYNFPSMVPLWFLPYAIAAGNTVVVKPSEQVPFSQYRLFELLHELKLPPGVVNMVHGGKDVVNGMLDNNDIAGVSFVGSSPVAQHVATRCGATGKRFQALGGAKNYTIVMDDCDWEKSIANIADSAFGCAGQRCLATAIAVGVGPAYKKLEAQIVERAKQFKVGEGHQPGVTMGPVISAKHKERVLGYIEKGIKEGAKLLLDGRNCKVEGFPNGHFIGPTIFGNVTPEMTIGHEEIFGPVLSLSESPDLASAIQTAKNHPLANAASIYTSNGSHARKFTREIDAAMVGVNIGVAAPMAYFTFGGSKGSFFGDLKAHGRESIAFYTQNKTAIQRWW
ncbi:MAG: malonate-semialdehyde dehydrogenase (acetylating) / methylmalonate-semialdehyde dehydrogenase [Myxococcales bacterium]|nr:malonate-semialdehyde dehydrogenase (acetylating) / methylmalonate-semialdehyde dehydrogenase [Myxococcales bacterium]